jgi:hypothetical protein
MYFISNIYIYVCIYIHKSIHRQAKYEANKDIINELRRKRNADKKKLNTDIIS